MEYFWVLYAITRLDGIRGFVLDTMVLLFFIAAPLLFYSVYHIIEEKKIPVWLRRMIIILPIVFILCGFTRALLPTNKEAMMITGGIVAIEAAKTDEVRSIAKNSLAYVDEWLKSQVKEIKDGRPAETK